MEPSSNMSATDRITARKITSCVGGGSQGSGFSPGLRGRRPPRRSDTTKETFSSKVYVSDFRRQLQRALSLSSFETEDTHRTPKSSAGDTTEDQLSSHSENDGSSVHSDGVAHSHKAHIDPGLFSNARDVEKIEGWIDLPEDRDMIALECVAELDVRMKNVESSMNNQECLNELVRGDLASILS
ncbi:hypothetical protein AFGD_007259 [Aspergillus flavus]|nr:hypothetical protein AFGD_007259 [Aspergillus flavus]